MVDLKARVLEKILFFLFAIFLGGAASATMVEEMPLPEMVSNASDIAVVTMEQFSGRAKDGRLATKGIMRSGPGMGNTFVVTLRVLEVLKGTSLRKNMLQVVELWPGWHMEANLSTPVDRKLRLVVFMKQSDAGLVPVFDPDPYLAWRYVGADVRKLIRPVEQRHLLKAAPGEW